MHEDGKLPSTWIRQLQHIQRPQLPGFYVLTDLLSPYSLNILPQATPKDKVSPIPLTRHPLVTARINGPCLPFINKFLSRQGGIHVGVTKYLSDRSQGLIQPGCCASSHPTKFADFLGVLPVLQVAIAHKSWRPTKQTLATFVTNKSTWI